MVLDPRHYRLDELLRRPYRPNESLGSAGLHVTATTTEGWGFPEGVFWDGTPFTGLRLELTVDGEPLLPAAGHWRPSHVTRYALHTPTDLQVVEDRFVAKDDVLVTVLGLRNPSDDSIFVDVAAQWGLLRGENAWGWVHRLGPPLDDLALKLPATARVVLVFVLGIGPTEATARQRVESWGQERDPVAVQQALLNDWCEHHIPLFDCPNPYLTRLYYHRQTQLWRGAHTIAPDQALEDAFADGDFDRPKDVVAAWERYVPEKLIGLRAEDDGQSLQLAPDNALDLPHFCLQNYRCAGQRLTIVWDDPAAPGDAYDDGDKGLTIYAGRRRLHHQETLAPCTVALPSPEG